METCYLSVTSRYVTYKGRNFTFSPIISVLTAMGIAEVWWNGTVGNKLSFDGTRTTIDNIDDLQAIMEVVESWTTKSLCAVWRSSNWTDNQSILVFKAVDRSTKLGYITVNYGDRLEQFKSDTGESSLDVPNDAIFQWYDADEDVSYKFNADGTKETIVWEQAARVYAQLSLIGGPLDDNNINYIGM